MAIARLTAPARAGERARSLKSQIGPVTQAIRTMRKAERIDDAVQALAALRQHDPEIDRIPALRDLRSALADRIEADIALLDALDPFADEREADQAVLRHNTKARRSYWLATPSDDEGTDDNGIGDGDGLLEQFTGTRFADGAAL